ncbi:MAG TPA: four helix bundle protein [bacterium]|nr:four helix bundle protein [bacterium]
MEVESLKIYQKSYAICLEVYELTKIYPNEELYGLVSQIRRAAVSIPSNIAEGYHRNGNKEFKQFLFIALGSTSELKTQINLSKDLKYIQDDVANILINKLYELEKMLYGFIKSLNKN